MVCGPLVRAPDGQASRISGTDGADTTSLGGAAARQTPPARIGYASLDRSDAARSMSIAYCACFF